MTKARWLSLRIRSLKSRVVMTVIVILIFGGILVTATAWINGQQAAKESYDRILLGAANDIARSVRISNGAVMTDLPVSAFELLAQAPDDRISYAVRLSDGTLVTGLETSRQAPRTAEQSQGALFFDGRLQSAPARFVEVRRLFAERDFSGTVHVIVGQTIQARQHMAVTLMRDALAPLVVAGAVLLLVGFFAVRLAVQPLERIAADLQRRDPYDLTPLPADGQPAEVVVLLDAVNRFMGRLDRQLNVMRNLISDTAHQLRTPVAAIRLQAEALLDDQTPEQSRRTMDRLLTRTQSLGRLLDQLLSRAMVIHRTDNLPREQIDLRDVALEVFEGYHHDLLPAGASVNLTVGEDPVIVLADNFSLSQAAGNLLSNALTHGVPPVRLGVETRGGSALLWVEDSGDGPPPDVLAKIGARFERSRSSGESSRGLGMSIVFSVAAAFGGTVELTRTDTGFRAILVLPLQPEAT